MSSRSIAALLAVLALTSASCSRDPQKLKLRYVASGDQYVAQKNYADAIIQYRNAVVQDASFGEARFKLGAAYQATGDLRNALREYVRAADLMPDDVEAQLHAGGLLLEAGQYPEAKARALAVLAKDPKNITGLVLMGNSLAGMKDMEGAISQIEEAIDADPHVTLSYANLGVLQLAQGNRTAAEGAFKRAIEADPKSIPARLNLGSFYWAAGDRASAERELKTAVAIDPKSGDANRSLAAFYLVSPRPSDAEPYLKAYAEIVPSVGSKLGLADFYTSNGRTKDAVSVLEALSKEKDGFARAKVRLASIDFRAGHRPQAHQTLEEVLKRDPTDQQTLEMKARFLVSEGKFADALHIANSVLEKNPQALPSYYIRGVALASMGSLEESIKTFQKLLELAPTELVPKMELAGLYFARGNSQMAAEFSAQVIKAAPGSPVAHFTHAQALVRLGNLDGAESELLALAKAFPSNSDVHTWLGILYESKHDLKRARESYNRALQLQPDSPVPLAGLVNADLVEKKSDVARATIESRLAAAPNDVALLLLAGSTYLTIGDQRNAESAYKKLIQVNPAYIDAYSKLGAIYLSQHRLDEAKKTFEEAAAQQTKPVAATTMVAMILELQGKPDEAQKQYEQALALDPSAAVAANNLALILADKNANLELALQLAQTAKAKLPDSSQVSDTLGWIYYKKGLPGLAVTALRQGVQQNPLNPTIHYHLGLAYIKNGEMSLAQQSLQHALKLNPAFKGAEDAKRVLASTRG